MTYREQMESPLWQKKRLKIFERDAFTCQLCLDKETQLHVHHFSYFGLAWEAPDSELLTVCKTCHRATEYLKKQNPSLVIYFVIKRIIQGKNSEMLICFCNNSKEYNKELVFITMEGDKIVDGLEIFNPTLVTIFHKLDMLSNGK